MFNLTFEFKLKPTATQITVFEDWLEQCRKVYNYALRERKDWYNSRKCQINSCSIRSEYIITAEVPRPTYSSQCKALTAYRKTSPALQRVNAQVLQQTLRRLEKAFVSMWEQNHGFPRFKKQGALRSLSFPQLGATFHQGNRFKLPGIGSIKFCQSRPIPQGASVKQARVVRRSSGWYIMLTLQWDVSIPDIIPHGNPVGIDVGLTNLLATSNGLLIKRTRFFADAERKLKLLQKRVTRKKIGSNNWKKAQKKVALLHEYVGNCRKDWHRKLSHQICDDAGMVFVEDLNLVELKAGTLGKHCLDAGFGQFFNILEQTCFKRGVYFQKVEAKKTSQICPNCLNETGKKELSERTHSCHNCGYTTDRDVAAAQVVLKRGLAAVGHTVKMLAEGKFIGIPAKQESPRL
ncbi:RNA-guided endonuclease InsQ/TnpB family protein [Microcoleus vaginatus]|uniref:RNA-guided endonuclease InsQ/TnpB family protein n=1 Tax=Microcoleus vaginatus TaxID=119532 RepID=UPI001F61AB77|nr:transposase [Microcoleus vaginatus HSN003]